MASPCTAQARAVSLIVPSVAIGSLCRIASSPEYEKAPDARECFVSEVRGRLARLSPRAALSPASISPMSPQAKARLASDARGARSTRVDDQTLT